MKLIATAQTFSRDNEWVEYEIYRHGVRYRVVSQDCGLGGVDDEPTREWATATDVRHLLTMPDRDAGVVEFVDETECEKIIEGC